MSLQANPFHLDEPQCARSSGSALAERADLTAATVSRLENLRQAAHPITAQALADALGVEVTELLGEEEKPPDADSSQGTTANAEPAA